MNKKYIIILLLLIVILAISSFFIIKEFAENKKETDIYDDLQETVIEETGVKIDIEEDGQVFIYSNDNEKAMQALEMIEDIVRDVEVGGIYYGEVVRIMNFGAFVDLGCGGKEGLLHISKISKERIKNIEDVLHVGDKVTVKVIGIDDQGRINLSMIDFNEPKVYEED